MEMMIQQTQPCVHSKLDPQRWAVNAMVQFDQCGLTLQPTVDATQLATPQLHNNDNSQAKCTCEFGNLAQNSK